MRYSMKYSTREPKLITQSYLEKWKTNSLFSALLWASMGIVLMIVRDQVHNMACYILGAVLLIQGIPHLFLFITEEEKHIFSISSLINGILISFLGIWALTLPNEVQHNIPDVIAFVTLLHGIKDIALSRRIFHLEQRSGSIAMCISVFTIICSIIILWLPLEETRMMSLWSGSLLMLDGISDFWMWTVLTNKTNEHRGI